jgi:hypothetical protein
MVHIISEFNMLLQQKREKIAFLRFHQAYLTHENDLNN